MACHNRDAGEATKGGGRPSKDAARAFYGGNTNVQRGWGITQAVQPSSAGATMQTCWRAAQHTHTKKARCQKAQGPLRLCSQGQCGEWACAALTSSTNRSMAP